MILCIGEAVIDLFHANIPSSGKETSEKAFFPRPGGCAYNTSIAIGRLKTPVSFFGHLSTNFFGQMQVERLRENNVNDSLLIRCEQNPVLAFIKVEEGKEPEYAFYDEGTSDRLLSEEELPQQLPQGTNCIMFGSISVVMEPIGSTIESFILGEAARRTVTAFDPNIRPFLIKDRNAYLKRFERLCQASTIVKVSQEDFEYIELAARHEEALKKLIDMGTRLAIITLGSCGAQAMLRHDSGNVITASTGGVKVSDLVDTVGAGDTFLGAFLVWLDRRGKLSHNGIADLSEDDLYDALVFANKAAAIVCGRKGAEPPYMEEIGNL
jgi:fructokinase